MGAKTWDEEGKLINGKEEKILEHMKCIKWENSFILFFEHFGRSKSIKLYGEMKTNGAALVHVILIEHKIYDKNKRKCRFR